MVTITDSQKDGGKAMNSTLPGVDYIIDRVLLPVEQSSISGKIWDTDGSSLLEVQFFWQWVNGVICCKRILCIAPRDCAGSENSVTFLGKQ